MQRVVRFNSEADRFSRLARMQFGAVAEAYRAIEAAYRVLAVSVRTELWWPKPPSGAPEVLGRREVTPARAEPQPPCSGPGCGAG